MRRKDKDGGLQWGRNLTVAEGGMRLRVRCSRALLQWGRNLTVAEGENLTSGTGPRRELQWGRNLTVAEGNKKQDDLKNRSSFNGAAT